MPKIICHMRNGFEFAGSDAKVRIPAKPTELELEHDWQVRAIKADCRIAVLTESEFKRYKERLEEREAGPEHSQDEDADDGDESEGDETEGDVESDADPETQESEAPEEQPAAPRKQSKKRRKKNS